MSALEPEVEKLLEEFGAAESVDYASMPVETIRAGFFAMNAPPAEEAVSSVEEHHAPGVGGSIPVRLYRPEDLPKDTSHPAPCLVFLHGGGFVTGSRDSHDAICRSLANRGRCVVVSPEYRLAPEFRFPAAAEDCHAVLQWVAESSSDLALDVDRIAVAGDSAGGNLAAVSALLCRDRGGPSLVHQLLIYPVIDAACDSESQEANARGYLLTQATMKWFWSQYLEEAAQGHDPIASPCCSKDLSGLPPATVITAEFDPLRSEGENYARALEAAGVPTRLERIDGQIHGFLTWAARLSTGRRVLAELGDSLREIWASSR